jgi:hypothetical protein
VRFCYSLLKREKVVAVVGAVELVEFDLTYERDCVSAMLADVY